MNSRDNKHEQDAQVEIFHRVNRLKDKAGGQGEAPGSLSTENIKNADLVIQDLSALYPQEIENMLGALGREWDALQSLENKAQKPRYVEEMSHLSNRIKDLAGTFGYTLMEDFGASLCQYILETDLSREEHYTIVQAHIDVMDVAFKQKLKDDGGALGRDLKATVQKAIEKYH